MRLAPSLAALALLSLAACGSEPELVAVSAPEAQGQYRVSMATLELKEPSLPAYALADEIAVETETGLVVSGSDVLWADKPDRAIALEITRHLSALTSARIAPSPWPFESLPEAALDLRFETVLARADGTFELAGQYFLGRLDDGRERSGRFDLSEPIAQPVGPVSISAARARAILALSELLAREALR
ncbi:PqiC family protein [Primorskyibacter sp. S187A]|uniref:PqiC family protein n=1 Tax=Primorskyibacter sp. S187A TaxID=3415130 RepID=UPI003C7CFC0B